MIKRFLDSFVHAAAWSSGGVIGARSGNELHYWASAGEARGGAGRIRQKETTTERDATAARKNENERANERERERENERAAESETEAMDEIDESIRKRARELRSSVDSLKNGRGMTGGYERISLDRRAAQYAIERKATSPRSIRVGCPFCESPVRVLRNDEVARCPSCEKRFWVEQATRT